MAASRSAAGAATFRAGLADRRLGRLAQFGRLRGQPDAGQVRVNPGDLLVPYLNCDLSKGAYSSQWIGLDGFVGRPDSVEQDGIEADCSAAGRPSYQAWHAMYPRRRAVPKLAIRSGDSVTASVSFDPANTKFTLTLSDSTSGGHFRVHARCPRGRRCPRDSAEVISSTPATETAGHLTIRPLADYGAVSFSGISITDRADRRGALRSAHWAVTRIIQARPAAPFQLIARPTPIEADAFDNYWSRALANSAKPVGPLDVMVGHLLSLERQQVPNHVTGGTGGGR
jgi:hypothetical protein